MSLQSATEFANGVFSNPALLSEVTATVNGKSEAEASSAISALGKSKGYDFTSEEAATLRQSFMKQLSDADLDGVAGGVNDGGAAQIGVTYVAGQLAGQGIPGGGGLIGAGVGAGVGAAMGGASASDSLAAGAVGAAQNLNESRSVVQQIFSGW
jgi:Nif11 domain